MHQRQINIKTNQKTLFKLLITTIVWLCSGCVSNPISDWDVVFEYSGAEDWSKSWFLEGDKASVSNSPNGLLFSAGPDAGDHASHAVLWSKASFDGDIKVEYDYTRLDNMTDTPSVNILYLQSTGTGLENAPYDIRLSSEQRKVPWMKSYFMNMNLLHISYATTGPNRSQYIAARRYPAKKLKEFNKSTSIPPIYNNIALFEPDKTYHITAIKQGRKLQFQVEHGGISHTFEWDLSAYPAINEGRIGFRHMWARSSLYQNIKVYLRQ